MSKVKTNSHAQELDEETTLTMEPREDVPTEKQGEENQLIAFRKKIVCKSPSVCHKNVLNYERVSPSYRSFLITINHTIIKNATKEALKYPYWRKGIDEEMQALIKN